MNNADLVEIFCILDKFCKYLEPELKKRAIESDPEKVRRNRKPIMSDSEIMLIMILFHTYRFRDHKSFYTMYICKHMKSEFPRTYIFVS